MCKKFHGVLLGISVLPALIVMPVFAAVITVDTEYDEEYIASEHEALRGGDLEANGARITFNEMASFIGNSTTGDLPTYGFGGALFIDGVTDRDNTSIEFKKSATFENNTAIAGGAVYNQATLIFDSDAAFINNSAIDVGALVGHAGSVTEFGGTATFTGNHAVNTAGAISNAGQMIFDGLATFSGNYTESNLSSSVGNSGTMTFNSGLVVNSNGFDADGNVGSYTGFSNSGTLSITGGNVEFINNKANRYSGLYANAGTVSIYGVETINFANNQAVGSSAGALGTHENADLTSLIADNIIFDNNSSTGDGYGGAIFTASSVSILGGNNTFSNNTSTTTGYGEKDETYFGGGAIHVRSVGGDDQVIIGTTDSNNTFYNNASNEQGGAIFIRNAGNLTINGTTLFSENTAAKNGGAIYIRDAASVLTFNGDVTFSGNTANGVANDIYNNGTINFNGNVTLDGGITGNGTLVLSNGKFLNIGNASITQDTINMNGGRIIATIGNVDDDYRINVGTFSGEGTIALTLAGEGTYALFGGSTFENTVFEGDITFDSPIYNLVWTDSNHSVTAARKTAEEIAASNGVSDGAANTVLNLMDSSSNVLNDLGMVVQEQLALGNVAPVEEATKAIHPETESVTQAVSTSVQNAIANLAAGRMALMRQSIGRSGGDMPARSGVWVEGMYNKTKQNDVFNGYTRGVVAGIDTQFSRSFMVGIGYSYAHSDVAGSARDTEIDSNTVFVYGQYKPTAWYMNAMVNYTMSDYEEKSNVLGTLVKADYDVDAFGAQVMTGYDFAGGITPEIGLRYMHISADEYKNSLGIKNKFEDADYLTAVLGTKYAFDYRVARGFTLSPELRYAVKYDVVSDEQVATVIMPGINSYVLDGARLSRVGAELGGGLVMKYQDFSLALNYDIELREGYTSQTGRVRARFVF